ncbi:phytoene desaturase family protein [Brachybacterium timonense]|uniref:phytoene desaturase family protein n=1 Tax=Brachybacterium timonense TaxID=2050896 RepID=UPI000D0AC1E8|nr:NAD(P)/FAD-dependent oxidoreductase [Brachybacterium timonense]
MSAVVGREQDVVVVGSGPNGLAAAVTLARAGLQVLVLEAEQTVGGGARTLDLGMAAGIRHDICSAVHPMALASPFFTAFDLEARGVELLTPEASYAQPLDAEPAAIAWRDVERTADGLGADAPVWRRVFSMLSAQHEAIIDVALSDKRSVPSALLSPAALPALAAFGAMSGLQGTPAWGVPLRTERARALLTGVAAHAIGALPSLAPSATGMLLAALAHAGGWPIPRGGSQAITDALAADLRAHGGRIITGYRVRSAADVPPARAVLADLPADTAAELLAERIPSPLHRSLRSLGHGHAAAKADFVVNAPIPWRDAEVRRAGTAHLGGTRRQMADAEAQVMAGRIPEAPVVLVSDPAGVDPSREVDGLRPVWAYAHVPFNDPTDPTDLITAQIERFAPGFRDTIVAARGIPAARMHEHNASLVGGDIALGALSAWRMMARPTAAWDPFRLGASGWYLCSSATPPAPGVHGMSGWHAARRVLQQVFGVRHLPSLAG